MRSYNLSYPWLLPYTYKEVVEESLDAQKLLIIGKKNTLSHTIREQNYPSIVRIVLGT